MTVTQCLTEPIINRSVNNHAKVLMNGRAERLLPDPGSAMHQIVLCTRDFEHSFYEIAFGSYENRIFKSLVYKL